MQQPTTDLEASALGAAVELGKLLGQRKAFGLIAGRCSAAQAAALKRIRDDKGYKAVAPTWEDFCQKEIHVSRVHANRIINWLDEFGPAFFELAQLTPISPAEYRILAPAIADHRIEANGKAIALIPERAEEIGAALDELRRNAASQKERVSTKDRMEALDRQCKKVTGEFEDLSLHVTDSDREYFSSVLLNTIGKLRQIDQQL